MPGWHFNLHTQSWSGTNLRIYEHSNAVAVCLRGFVDICRDYFDLPVSLLVFNLVPVRGGTEIVDCRRGRGGYTSLRFIVNL